MAHPVYKLKDGTKVPSVTTILNRFKDSGGLIHWAWQMGIEGKDYREERDKAADIGSMVHAAVEAWTLGNAYAFEGEPPAVEKAQRGFGAFREWALSTNFQVTNPECSMVSERWRFGGTPDAILVGGKRAIGDWKSSGGLYTDYIIQVAAYGMLWEENHPEEPITGGYHLLRFDKTHGDFTHKWWGELETAKKAFLLMRELYDMDKELKQRIK